MPTKKSVQLAQTIVAEIEKYELGPGYMLGSEMQLCERYGVSRAILRETVRLLEHYSIVEMRNGRNGGLVVSDPNLDTLTEAIALLLRRRDVTPANLAYARWSVELAGARLAAESSNPEKRQLLAPITDSDDLTDAELVRSQGAQFHLVIAQLSGNPIIEIFTTMLVELTRQRIDLNRSIAMNKAAIKSHQHIAAAVIDGDADEAERAMTQHLRAIAAEWETTKPTFPTLLASPFREVGTDEPDGTAGTSSGRRGC